MGSACRRDGCLPDLEPSGAACDENTGCVCFLVPALVCGSDRYRIVL